MMEGTCMVEFNFRLIEAMRLANKSTQNVADHLGISYQAVKKVLDGKSSALNAENTAKAARYLGVDIYWLATGEGSYVMNDGWPFPMFSPTDYFALDENLRLEFEDRLLGAITRNKRPKSQ